MQLTLPTTCTSALWQPQQVCDAGSHNDTNNAKACAFCAPGRASPGANLDSECPVCEAGTATNATGSSACSECNAGSFSLAASRECSLCPPGKSSGGRASECVDCEAGRSAPASGSPVCDDCPGDEYSSPGATSCDQCNKFFYYSPDVGSCVRCPEGTDCPTDGGSTLEDLALENGYWRISADSTDILECRMPDACAGSSNVTDAVGATGDADRRLTAEGGSSPYGDRYCSSGYTGPLCGVCDDDHYHQKESSSCAKCKNDADPWRVLTSVGVIFLLGVIVAAVLYKIHRSRKDDENESVDAGKYILWVQKMMRKGRTRAKALWAFGQINVNVSFNCGISFPRIYEQVTAALGFVNIDLIPALGLECLARFNYISTMLLTTLGPIVVCLLLWLQ